MKRADGTRKLTLHKETLRRFTGELTEQQLAKVLGGDPDGGPQQEVTDTFASTRTTFTRTLSDTQAGTTI